MSILHWLSADAWRRFGLSVGAAVITFLALPHGLSVPTRTIAVWDSFAVCATLFAWIAVLVTPQSQLSAHAQGQDLSRLLIFGFVVTAACVALFAVAFLIRTHQAEMHAGFTLHVLLALGTVALSWALLHTLYSLHYAHVYYGDADQTDARYSAEKGLDFPGEEAPDYLDFAYFAFVIGMTCQVSDVQVTSKRMRRLTLIHGIISFGFNTVILALLINTVSGFL